MSRPNIRDAKCVLIIGGTAGLGRALASAIHDLPSEPTVIVTGRRQERLEEISQTGKRIEGISVDVTAGRSALKEFADSVITKYPDVKSILYSSYTFA